MDAKELKDIEQLLNKLDIDVCELMDILIAHYEQERDECDTADKENKVIHKLNILYGLNQ